MYGDRNYALCIEIAWWGFFYLRDAVSSKQVRDWLAATDVAPTFSSSVDIRVHNHLPTSLLIN